MFLHVHIDVYKSAQKVIICCMHCWLLHTHTRHELTYSIILVMGVETQQSSKFSHHSSSLIKCSNTKPTHCTVYISDSSTNNINFELKKGKFTGQTINNGLVVSVPMLKLLHNKDMVRKKYTFQYC